MTAERSLEQIRTVLLRPLVRWIPQSVTPNALSWVRFVLAAVLAWLLWRRQFPAALVIYLVALLSDALDGELARICNQTSRFGARLDPTVDKVLHGVLFIAFLPDQPLLLGSLLVVDAILLLLGLLLVLHARKADLSASTWGKWKMILQSVGLLGLFLTKAGVAPIPPYFSKGVLLLAFLFALLSLVSYIRRFFDSVPG